MYYLRHARQPCDGSDTSVGRVTSDVVRGKSGTITESGKNISFLKILSSLW